jgi:hypothetical protein
MKQRMSAYGPKQTSKLTSVSSAYDQKRTSTGYLSQPIPLSEFDPLRYAALAAFSDGSRIT